MDDASVIISNIYWQRFYWLIIHICQFCFLFSLYKFSLKSKLIAFSNRWFCTTTTTSKWESFITIEPKIKMQGSYIVKQGEEVTFYNKFCNREYATILFFTRQLLIARSFYEQLILLKISTISLMSILQNKRKLLK